KGLAPGGADRRRDLDHRDRLGVLDGPQHRLDVVPLPQSAHRAVGDALAAQRAVGLPDGAVFRHVDPGVAAGGHQVPDVQALDLVADLDAAHALDALGGVPDQGEGAVPAAQFFGRQVFPKGVGHQAQVVGQGLQLAVAAAHAEGALGVVPAEDQLQVGAPGQPDPGVVGVDGHALGHHVVAGGDELVLPFHLDAAQPAGADLVDPFQVAQVGDMDPGREGGVQDGGPFRHADGPAVDVQRYHLIFLPPLNTP